MTQAGLYRPSFGKVALIGNFLPRKCGIATFTTDLLLALTKEDPGAEFWAVVMNDVPEGYCYPPQVRFEIRQKVLADYRMAADFARPGISPRRDMGDRGPADHSD